MEQYVRDLLKFKPALLTSYSSPLEVFANYCREHGVHIPSLKGIICSAEQLFDYQRELFAEVFGVPVFNRYGSREFGAVAQECGEHVGLHVNAERVLVEILDNDDRPCKPGEIGEIVITDFNNYAFPFVRYRTGDLAAWAAAPCPCGRSLPLLTELSGRVFDVIVTPAGKKIGGTFWTITAKRVSKRIRQIQVIQDSIEAIEICLVVEGGEFEDAERAALRAAIAEEAPDLKVSFSIHDRLELTSSGKQKFVISNLEGNDNG
jgi:phenylacetate-CoA ligase